MKTVLSLGDWEFRVDRDATRTHTLRNSTDHCLCPYCRNYYETVDLAQPRLRFVLDQFGIQLEGPSELMPLEHDLLLACYRCCGSIAHPGSLYLYVDDVRLYPEPGEEGTFLLWVGPMELPWIQPEAPEEVLSPANEPEFLDRMARKWMELNEDYPVLS